MIDATSRVTAADLARQEHDAALHCDSHYYFIFSLKKLTFTLKEIISNATITVTGTSLLFQLQ